jgi:hypothetical protein
MAWLRSWTCSLVKMLETWLPTVFSLITSRPAISRLRSQLGTLKIAFPSFIGEIRLRQ